MKLLEYEAKEIFRKYTIPVPVQIGVFKTAKDVKSITGLINQTPTTKGAWVGVKTSPTAGRCPTGIDSGRGAWVVKAQVLAGGRGKAGGIKIAKTPKETADFAKKMLGMKIATHQTHGQSLIVKEVLVENATDIAKEIYISAVLDRSKSTAMIIASSEGGMSIEELAKEKPDAIIKVPVDINTGLLDFQARRLAFDLKIPDKLVSEFVRLAKNIVRIFIEYDASLVEINPLAITRQETLVAIDAKIVTDDNALFKHKDLSEKPDHECSEIEKLAKEIGINYIGLDGNIGCMVNGAGLAMATLDTIKLAGGNAANFLDVGGGANVEQITKAFQIILKEKKVKTILVNIFGGIMRCDNIAQGIVEATKKAELKVPLIVRLEGTKVQEGKEILKNSKIKIEQADSLWEAAQKAVRAAK